MKVYYKAAALHDFLNEKRQKGTRIGFVPTMGALHQGHLSLVDRSKAETELTVTSIFVNPTQFDNPLDFDKYPRLVDNDLMLLKQIKNDIVFVPAVEEMYPDSGTYGDEFDFGMLGHIMEGAYRKGHFKGVAQVVSRFLNIINPHVMYLGQKDYQQYMILKKLVDEKFEMELQMVPTEREDDGLAMSSRNSRLTPTERNEAPAIFETLRSVKERYRSKSPGEWRQWGRSQLLSIPSIKEIDYFEIVNADNLSQIKNWEDARSIIACTAVRMNKVRLIDNMFIKREKM